MALSVSNASDYLREAYRQDRLAHAYLLTGADSAARAAFIATLAGEFMNEAAQAEAESEGGGLFAEDEVERVEIAQEESESAEPSVDLRSLVSDQLILLEPESASRRIKVDSVREAIIRLQHKSSSAYRFLVIDEADRMNEMAANALLKTLEEPSEGVIIFLSTGLPDLLLTTIHSRCVSIDLQEMEAAERFKNESCTAMLAALEDHFSQIETQKETLGQALGLASRFKQLLAESKQEISREQESALKAQRELYQKRSEGDFLKQEEDRMKAMISSLNMIARKDLLTVIYLWLGDCLRLATGRNAESFPDQSETMQRVAEKLGAEELIRRSACLEKLFSHFETNVQENLAIDVAFLQGFRLLPSKADFKKRKAA